MKHLPLIILLLFAGCKKKDSKPEETPVPPAPVVTPIVRKNNTIKVHFKTYGESGYLYLKTSETTGAPWSYEVDYNTATESVATITTDRSYALISFIGYDKPIGNNVVHAKMDVEVYVNDTLTQSWSGSTGSNATISLYKK